MKLVNEIGNEEIQSVLKKYPPVGDILDKYDIGCIKCSIGTCLLQDVVSVHFLGDEIEAQIEAEINEFLKG
jgi:hypothetical protein